MTGAAAVRVGVRFKSDPETWADTDGNTDRKTVSALSDL